MEDSPPRKYYLSRKACLGILRRARERGKPLPPQLEAALKAQAGLTVRLTPLEPPPLAFHMNQRDEAIDLGETAGALMATSNMQMQTFVTAFAANQRDEVRDLHDVAGALAAQPGMKQQTFVADCLNPWDTQQARITVPEGVSPTINSGEAKPGGLVFAAGFCAGAGPSAGGIGYHEELAPTLKAAASGNMMPSVLCLNDQGGKVMECSEDVSGTLRAQEHGHQPLVFENHGIDARYTGPHRVSPTITARFGTGGNNTPIVTNTLFSRQRVDKFQEDGVVSTQSARQHKDATDLVYQETVGALTTSDSKGPNSQYVSQDKLVLGPPTEPSETVPLGRGEAREQSDASPQGDAERRGLCFDDGPLLIRRLTPRECERLQGFPDDWTNLPGAADAPRYKALGNSVAIPCVEYLMRGMALVLKAG